MAAKLVECPWDGEIAGVISERRWYGLLSEISRMQAECAALREVSLSAEIAWRSACVRVAEFEALRDAIEDEISDRADWVPRATTHEALRYDQRVEFRRVGRG